jgi:hypothetical protein
MNKFVAVITRGFDQMQFDRMQFELDAPDIEIACKMGRAIQRKMEVVDGMQGLTSSVRWAPELEHDQSLN